MQKHVPSQEKHHPNHPAPASKAPFTTRKPLSQTITTRQWSLHYRVKSSTKLFKAQETKLKPYKIFKILLFFFAKSQNRFLFFSIEPGPRTRWDGWHSRRSPKMPYYSNVSFGYRSKRPGTPKKARFGKRKDENQKPALFVGGSFWTASHLSSKKTLFTFCVVLLSFCSSFITWQTACMYSCLRFAVR